MKQFGLEKCLFVTINLVEDLLDLLLAPIAVNIHFQHAGLGTNQSSNRRKTEMFRELTEQCVRDENRSIHKKRHEHGRFVRVCVCGS